VIAGFSWSLVVAVAVLAVLTIAVVISSIRSAQYSRHSSARCARPGVGRRDRCIANAASSRAPAKTGFDDSADHVIGRSRRERVGKCGRRDHRQRLHRPEQREYRRLLAELADAVTKLKAADSPIQTGESPSTPETLGKVIATDPPANQTSAITNVITVIVGFGAGDQGSARRHRPVRRRRAKEPDRQWLHQVQPGAGDSPRPAGEVLAPIRLRARRFRSTR